MARSTAKDRVAQDEAFGALENLEVWAAGVLNGEIPANEAEGARLARELVEKVKKWMEGTN